MSQIKLNSRQVNIALAGFWSIDGLLQLQHQMFSSAFIYANIYPAANGQPRPVYDLVHFGARIFLAKPVIFNSLIALIQLGLGVLIFVKKTSRWALITSVFWAAIVWALGESFGGVLSGHAMLLSGAPGAALIYGVIALATLPKDKNKRALPAYWLAYFWSALWTLGAIFQLLPGQNKAADIASMVSSNASGAPTWLASIDNHTAGFIFPGNAHMSLIMSGGAKMNGMVSHPVDTNLWIVLVLSLLMLLIGLAAIPAGYSRRLAVTIGIVLSICFWVVGQNLGGYYTGLATDFNSAPLFVLLGLAILSTPDMIGRKELSSDS